MIVSYDVCSHIFIAGCHASTRHRVNHGSARNSGMVAPQLHHPILMLHTNEHYCANEDNSNYGRGYWT